MRDSKPPIQCLLVSDDPAVRERILGLLEAGTRAKYVVGVAKNIDQAMELLAIGDHEVCMVDYALEDDLGCDFVRRLQLQGITTPILMFTESEEDVVEIEVVMSGASDLLAMDELTGSLLERAVHVTMIRSMAEARLRRMATRDHLTKLFNRAHFERFATTELLRANRCGQNAAMMMVDVDRFKTVNDTFGHSAGDDILRTVAQVCQNEVRAIDCVGRFGGDEFVILLMQTGIEGASIVAERIRASIDGAVLRREYDAVPVSISAGISSTEQGFVTYTPLFEAADLAARKAKQSGRNCVLTWTAEMQNDIESAPEGDPGSDPDSGAGTSGAPGLGSLFGAGKGTQGPQTQIH